MTSQTYTRGIRYACGLAFILTAVACVPGLAADHPNISGFWEPRAGSAHRPVRPAFTDAAQLEMKKPNKSSNTEGVDEADANCLPIGQPWTLFQSAPIDIAQDNRETTMIYESRSLPFHIYTDGRSHAQGKLTLNGDSIGHWDGDSFIVDTIGFAPLPGHGALQNLPNNETTHVVATYTLANNGQELHGHFRIEDAKWLTQPYEFDFVWYRDAPDEYAWPDVCDARDSRNTLK